ncbi:MAG TPA: hypothetical protein VLG71_02500, partial [Candidatus Limnocylindria bacterium]|nr:hypothetical protein [Candidatus Limnocylindria bacterium]
AHRFVFQKTLNSLFVLSRNLVIDSYDKNLRMPITEYLPEYLNFPCIRRLFLKNKKEFSTKKRSGRAIKLGRDFTVVPRICSELYFDTSFTPPPGIPVLCLVNDSWFAADYLRHLMLLFARFKALEWQADVVYVGHYRGVWITKEGVVQNI